MGSRDQNSNKKEEGDDGGVSGAAVGVTAVAGAAALAVWGLSKLFGSSKPEENNMMIGSSRSFKLEENNMLMGSTGSFKLQGIDDNKWTKPKYGWYKLNTDASSFPDSNRKAAAGGLIRDHRGEWIIGFTATLETNDILLAELHAVKEGLELALKEGLKKKVIIETDSEQAVDLIKNPNRVNPKKLSLCSKIEECRSLMMKLGDWNNIMELNYISREKNRCADAMARLAKNQTVEPLIIWEEPPRNLHIQNLLSADMN